MNSILKKTMALAVVASFATTLSAGEWGILPILKDGYKPNSGVALVVGYQQPDIEGVDGDVAFGAEYSLNCPLLQVPTYYIRQQISVTYFETDNLKMTNLEINPHYRLPIVDNLEFGFGPSFAAVISDVSGVSHTNFGYGVGVGLEYMAGSVILGLESRYQWTAEEDFGGVEKTNMNNLRSLAKVGYKF